VIHIVNFAISLQSDVTPGQPELLLELNPDEHVLQEARVHDEVPRGRDQAMGTITCTCHMGTNCPEPCVCPSLCSHCQRLGRTRESMGTQDHRRRRRNWQNSGTNGQESPTEEDIDRYASSLQQEEPSSEEPNFRGIRLPDDCLLSGASNTCDDVPGGPNQAMGSFTCCCHVGVNCPHHCVCPNRCSFCRNPDHNHRDKRRRL